jgi:uncharacterized protein
MSTLDLAVSDFLAQKTLAVVGVSRSGSAVGNLIYKKLRDAGYQVVATHPEATELEGDPCYPDLKSAPGPIDGVVITTHPDASRAVVQECIDLGIPRVWMHRSFGQGSVSDEATHLARENGLKVIDGACPMMFVPPIDVAHRCFRWILGVTGKLPDPAR